MSLDNYVNLPVRALIFIILLLFLSFDNKLALTITNKLRYSRPKMYNDLQISTSDLSYNSQPIELNKFKTLDEEDRDLLNKFYQQSEKGDSSFKQNLSIENIWRSKLLNQPAKVNFDDILKNEYKKNRMIQIPETSSPDTQSEWQIESIKPHRTPDQIEYSRDGHGAKYSPLMRILTSYDPLNNNIESITNSPTTNKIVGVTVGMGPDDTQPNLNSTLAIDAIKLHDDMLKPAPRDGKVRVRMYYHQAVHDDVRLYGNGPWKYWGHGWGMELGFGPKNSTKDFYQRGYNIERAYGRDFCKNQTNCRKSDPTFFKDMLDAGKYSKNIKINSLLDGM